MSVSRSGENAKKDRSRWDNLTKQKVRVQADYDGTQAGGGTLFDPLESVQPAGGVDRGKVMELVGMRVLSLARIRNTGDNPTNPYANYELTTDPEPYFADPNEAERTTDYEGISGMDREVWSDEEDPGTLDAWRMNTSAAFEDETNGSAGGAEWEHYEYRVNFRDEYGVTGPLFDQHDSINLHARIFSPSGANIDFDTYLSFDWLEWQVEEDLDDRLQPC